MSFDVFLFAAVAISIACYIRIHCVLSMTTDTEMYISEAKDYWFVVYVFDNKNLWTFEFHL